jgi:hypothetical protein
MKHSSTLIICCLLQSACVPAMVTKSPGAYGRVTDARTHAPVVHASVSFPGRGPVATTGEDGQYDFPHTEKLGIIVLLPWEFQTLPLQVSHPRYQTATIEVRTIFIHERQDVALQAKP